MPPRNTPCATAYSDDERRARLLLERVDQAEHEADDRADDPQPGREHPGRRTGDDQQREQAGGLDDDVVVRQAARVARGRGGGVVHLVERGGVGHLGTGGRRRTTVDAGDFWPLRWTGSWKTGLLLKTGLAMASSWTDRALSDKAVTRYRTPTGARSFPGSSAASAFRLGRGSPQGPMYGLADAPLGSTWLQLPTTRTRDDRGPRPDQAVRHQDGGRRHLVHRPARHGSPASSAPTAPASRPRCA